MATPSKKITNWSFSRYNVYKLCPFKAKLSIIDKIREPQNEAMARGDAIHKLAEKYVKGELLRLPAELKLFEDDFKELRKQYKKSISGMVVEDNWSFTKDWDGTRWDDWINCWVRIKLDLAYQLSDTVLRVRDWKTGKHDPRRQEEYMEQLELYALAALLALPHIEEVQPELAYLDLGIVEPKEPLRFTRADIPRLKKLWEKRVKPMLSDTRFAPRPNDKCKWCHYRAGNKANGGGQCKY